MGPDLRLAFRHLRTVEDKAIKITVAHEGRRHPGRVLRYQDGIYCAEFADGEAADLLRLLASHYTAARATPPMEGRVARLSIEVLLKGDAAGQGRRTAETCRLIGLALGRLEMGEAQGLIADAEDERRVSWRLIGPSRRRAAG